MNKIILDEINSLASEEKAQHLLRFFKTGKGQYGEGDLFLGINVPTLRAIAKKHFAAVSLDDIQILIENPYHEVRMVSLFMLIFIFKKATNEAKSEIFNLYLKNVEYINNWDLVDLSAPQIVGSYIFETKNFDAARKLAEANHLWSNRIAVVCNWYIIRQNEFGLILELSEKFLHHKHDLMQKAVGWMLREMGKRDIDPLYEFLDKHHKVMPRTMLRYSIEKLSPEKRYFYMH